MAEIKKATIYTMEGRILKTFDNVGCSGACEFTWDGQSDNGEKVSEGMYIVQLFNDKEAYYGKIIHRK